MIYRNAKYLNESGIQSCIRCGRLHETRAAHYNGFRAQSFGKGRGIKPHDFLVADFCHECDADFSEASYHEYTGGSKSPERSEQFMFWILKTLERRLENGWRLAK